MSNLLRRTLIGAAVAFAAAPLFAQTPAAPAGKPAAAAQHPIAVVETSIPLYADLHFLQDNATVIDLEETMECES